MRDQFEAKAKAHEGALSQSVQDALNVLNREHKKISHELNLRKNQIYQMLMLQSNNFLQQQFIGKTQKNTSIWVRIAWEWDEDKWRKDLSTSSHRGSTGYYVRIGKGKLCQSLLDQDLPYYIPFINHRHLLFNAESKSLDRADDVIQSIAFQLLTSLHPSNVKIIALDPLGLGEKFELLTSLGKDILGPKIYHSKNEIEQILETTIQHISTIIQKYLSTEYEDLDTFNKDAGAVAEPYRLVCISNFPTGLSQESIQKISSIASNGVKAGVHLLISRDVEAKLPYDFNIDSISRHCEIVNSQDGHNLFCHNSIEGQVIKNLTLDHPPSKQLINALAENIKEEATNSKGIEISFVDQLPAQMWEARSDEYLSVDIGQIGAKDKQSLLFGNQAHHALIGGKTGMGKSVLLHNWITGLAYKYSPEEASLYLIDFKVGVEFQRYEKLPHVKVLAYDADREFALSVIENLVDELERRGDLFKRYKQSSLAGYRNASGNQLCRLILVLDEFQVLFKYNDKISRDANRGLSDLSRRGRSFGINLILTTQTLSNIDLSNDLLEQMGVRIALPMSEADSTRILGRDNDSAKYLSRPGEAILNEDNQQVAANKRFQVYYSDLESMNQIVEDICNEAKRRNIYTSSFIYKKEQKVNLADNKSLRLQVHSRPEKLSKFYHLFVGQSFALTKDHFSFTLKRQSSENILMVGNEPNTAFSVTLGMILSTLLASPTYKPSVVYFINNDDVTSDYNSYLDDLDFGAHFKHIRSIDEEESIETVYHELNRRLHSNSRELPNTILLCIYGFHNSRSYQAQGFGAPSVESTLGKLHELLTRGPQMGIHTLIWSATKPMIDKLFQNIIGVSSDFGYKVILSNEARGIVNATQDLPNHCAYFITPQMSEAEKFKPYRMEYTTRLEMTQLEQWIK